MAMRPRGGGSGGVGSRRGSGSGVVRSVYENFKPVSEWQQYDESHVLNIYLPGFNKEQIRVSTEGRKTIRVRGERLVAGNKWSRFVEDFQVPENGEMNSVRAKFHGGILSITVPKERAGKPQDALPPKTREVDDTQKQSTPEKGQVKPEAQSFLGDPHSKQDHDDNQKGRDKHFPEIGTNQSREETNSEPLKASAEPNKERDTDDDQRGRSVTPLKSTRNEVSQETKKEESSKNQKGRSFTTKRSTGNVISENAEKKDGSETTANHVVSKKPEDVTKEKVHKEGKETMGGSDLPEAETTKTKESEKSIATGIPGKTADNEVSYGASKQLNYKKAVRGLTELNEGRQLMVNMGVAMLVIVALTAYVAHSFASVKHKN